MKINRITSLLITILLLVGCAKQKVKPTKILANEETRSEIMETIINDDRMISQFMDKMINTEEGKLMLAEKRDMIHIRQMMREISNDSLKVGMMMDHMMVLMQKDSTICRMIGHKIENNPHMMGLMGNDCTMICPLHN